METEKKRVLGRAGYTWESWSKLKCLGQSGICERRVGWKDTSESDGFGAGSVVICRIAGLGSRQQRGAGPPSHPRTLKCLADCWGTRKKTGTMVFQFEKCLLRVAKSDQIH